MADDRFNNSLVPESRTHVGRQDVPGEIPRGETVWAGFRGPDGRVDWAVAYTVVGRTDGGYRLSARHRERSAHADHSRFELDAGALDDRLTLVYWWVKENSFPPQRWVERRLPMTPWLQVAQAV